MIFGKWSFSLYELTGRPLFVYFRTLLQKVNFLLQLFNQFLEFGVFFAQPGYLGVCFYLNLRYFVRFSRLRPETEWAWAATIAAKRSTKDTAPIEIFIRIPPAIHASYSNMLSN